MQSVDGPETEPGLGRPFTIMLRVAEAAPQDPATVYVMVAVPAPIPLTTPVVALTDAIEAFDVDQVPPETELVNVTDAVWQTAVGPDIVPAVPPVPTVTTLVAIADPQLLVTE